MAIEQIKVRARVEVAGISVETPYVQSFNVRKQRGQISTFDASLKVPASTSATLSGGDVKIYAGENSANNLIFTGMCRVARISPCYDDPYYVILSISGTDKLILLQGKKFTRRCRATDTSWCSITSVVRHGLKSGKFDFSNAHVITMGEGTNEFQNNVIGRNPNLQVHSTNAPQKPSEHVKITAPTAQVTVLAVESPTSEEA